MKISMLHGIVRTCVPGWCRTDTEPEGEVSGPGRKEGGLSRDGSRVGTPTKGVSSSTNAHCFCLCVGS